MLTIAGGIILAVIALFVGFFILAGICETVRGTSGTSGGGFWLVVIVAVLVYIFTNEHL